MSTLGVDVDHWMNPAGLMLESKYEFMKMARCASFHGRPSAHSPTTSACVVRLLARICVESMYAPYLLVKVVLAPFQAVMPPPQWRSDSVDLVMYSVPKPYRKSVWPATTAS